MSIKRYILVIFTLGFTTFLLAHEEQRAITYKVNYLVDSLPQLKVAFNWKSDSQGYIRLKFENNSWGDNNIYDCIRDLEVHPLPDSIRVDRDSSLIVIKARPGETHRITYAIVQDFKDTLKNHHRYRPIINADYFHLLGMRLFMIPTNLYPDEESKARVHISWEALPHGALFHSSFGFEREQHISVTREELYASFFVGGDFRRYEFTYKGKPVYFLTRGEWESLTDAQVLGILKETIASQYRFWRDAIQNRYSVSLIPTTEKDTYSIGGSGLTDSFISFASNNPATTMQLMTWLYNHELMHKWLGRTIKNANEVEQYWFSEGFTDYYAYKLMLKNERIGLSEYIDLVNTEIVMPHYTNKGGVSTTPNAQLTFQRYWSQYGVYGKLPYRRGFLYAFLLDNQIKKYSHGAKSLDALMRDLLVRAEADPNFRLCEATFLEALSAFDIPDYKDQFERYINRGELIGFDRHMPGGLSFNSDSESRGFVVDAIQSESLVEYLKK